MIGLSTYAATKRSVIGFDWMNLSSGILKGAGGAFGGGDKGGDAAAVAERARLEDQRKAAEKSANTWKLVGLGGLAVILGYLLLRKPAVAV